MTAQIDDSRHPVVAEVVDLRASLSSLAATPVWGLSTTDTEAVLLEVTALATQVTQLQLRLLHHGKRVEVGADIGATSAANWLARASLTMRSTVHRAARLAAALDSAHPRVDAALADASINDEQAQVIVSAVDDLPDTVAAPIVAEAEAFLLHEAADHDAKALRILGRRLLEVIDLEAAEAEEARRLEAEAAKARAAASFTISDDGHGKCHGRFTLPSLHGSMLRKALLALAAPARHPDRPAEVLTKHKLGQAFMECRDAHRSSRRRRRRCHRRGHPRPGHADGRPQGRGPLRRHPDHRRRGPSAGLHRRHHPRRPRWEVRTARRRPSPSFHSRSQRVALAVRDGGCTADGCDRPPSMCHAHHDIPWSRGGNTDVKTGRLLCQRHHTLAHDQRYQLTSEPNGKVSFARRT